MSSESDIDEFYDAQDVTPQRTARLLSKSSISESELLLDLEKEEIRLLEQKKSIEDRRRQEEDEIQKKLASLDRKKQIELDRKAAARKSRENELRRKKLEEMRMFMSDESTPDRPTSKHGRDSDISDLQGHFQDQVEISESAQATGDQLTDKLIEQKLEALSFELEQSGHLNRGDFAKICDNSYQSGAGAASSDNDRFSNLSSSHYSSLDRTTYSFESDCFEDAAETTPSGTGSSSSHDKLSLGGSNVSVPGKINSKQLGMLAVHNDDDSKRKSSSLPPNLTSPESADLDLVKSTLLQEPDIIQSTKSLPRHQQPFTSTPKIEKTQYVVAMRPPPTTVTEEGDEAAGGGPVAPPRKRKSVKSETSERSSQDSELVSENCLSATSYPPSDRSHSNSPRTHRPSLDLSSATQGKCHVVATEDSAVKGDNEGIESAVSMDTVTEEDTTENKMADSQENLNDFDLDIEVKREDSVVIEADEKEDNFHNSERERADLSATERQRQQQAFIVRQKSKTLGGTTEEMKRAKAAAAGKVMSDKEILEQVMVTNLDTGEKIPLSEAEDKMPMNLNPLSLHIMRLTKEFTSEQKMKDGLEKEGHDEGKTVKTVKVPKKRGKKIKKFLTKSVRRIKSELKTMKEDKNSSSDEDELVDGRRMIKIKASHSHKGPYDFDLLVPVQNLAEESGGAVWTMKFSTCGKLLATGGQDNVLKIWVLKSAYNYFDGMRQKYSEAARVMRSPSEESTQSMDSSEKDFFFDKDEEEEESHAPFMRRPFCLYRGHTADLLDVSWSKNYFILSSSMDKTVRLWHVSRKECLCCFQHIDFVTAITFHPKDDRYFLSGSLDGKLRLWSIPEKKVALWNEVSGQSKLITAANFCSDGKIAVGTYDGRCVLYTADHLDYHTQIHVRSTRGKNAKGGKITGVEPFPGEHKILVTSNDSRIRLYDLRDKTLTCKYKGSANNSSRIKASFNSDGRYIICGSEDGCVFIWRTQHDFYKFYSVRRDRNDFWEGVKAHGAVVTAAIFAPDPTQIIKPQFAFMDSDDKEMTAGVRGEVIISADFNGAIKVFINKFKPGSGYAE